jgi:hypothetical protein
MSAQPDLILQLAHHIADFFPGGVIEQHRAEHRLFGLDRMRRHTQRGNFGVGTLGRRRGRSGTGNRQA